MHAQIWNQAIQLAEETFGQRGSKLAIAWRLDHGQRAEGVLCLIEEALSMESSPELDQKLNYYWLELLRVVRNFRAFVGEDVPLPFQLVEKFATLMGHDGFSRKPEFNTVFGKIMSAFDERGMQAEAIDIDSLLVELDGLYEIAEAV